jgi:hypothetical protein
VAAVVSILWCIDLPGAFAQVIGGQAEMERLRSNAEDAIANGDSDGAALNSGKAALMAAQLAKRQTDEAIATWYRGAEALFRAQEHAYRALALFQRAGGQPPASTGVCSSIRLAEQDTRNAGRLLAKSSQTPMEAQRKDQAGSLRTAAEEWEKTIEGMAADFECR